MYYIVDARPSVGNRHRYGGLDQRHMGLDEVAEGTRTRPFNGVQSAEANYYSVQAQKADLKRQIRETETLCRCSSDSLQQTIARGKLDSQSLPSTFSTGIGIQMLNNRPDVHYAEMSLAGCFYDIETARSRFYPSLTITPSATFTNSAGGGIVNPGKWLASAVGSLVQPIFMHGQLVAGLQSGKIEIRTGLQHMAEPVLSAGSEVSNALVLYNSSEEKSQPEAKQITTLMQKWKIRSCCSNSRAAHI